MSITPHLLLKFVFFCFSCSSADKFGVMPLFFPTGGISGSLFLRLSVFCYFQCEKLLFSLHHPRVQSGIVGVICTRQAGYFFIISESFRTVLFFMWAHTHTHSCFLRKTFTRALWTDI